jgi:pyruvate,orthophosphate dikinase
MRFEDHLVLHGLAIKKLASAEDVAAAVALDPEVVRTVLEANNASGRVTEIDGRYALLPATRIMLKGEYSRHYASLRRSEDFVTAYDQFERINEDLKTLITQWQVREVAGAQLPNDHSDAAYDERIVDRLGALHERFEPILGRMARDLPRLASYLPRLNHALERVELGEGAWVSDVKIDSYHTVWFELHEDLLLLVGRARIE